MWSWPLMPIKQQFFLLQRIASYLKYKKRDKQVINKFKKIFGGGYCFGITILWAYSRWLSGQPKSDPSKERDDYEWFLSVTDLIVNWFPLNKIEEQQEHQIERFISLIEYFQNLNEYSNYSQVYAYEFLKDTNQKRQFTKEYSLSALLTLKQLKQVLSSEIIKDNKIIMIGSEDHVIGLFKENGTYHFFDTNYLNPEISTKSLETIANYIVYSFSETYGIAGSQFRAKPISIQIFDSDDSTNINTNYNSQDEILSQIKNLTHKTSIFTGSKSALEFAVKMNDLNSANYYLKHTQDKKIINKSFFSAITHNYIDITSLFIDNNKININCINKKGLTPLMHALLLDDTEHENKIVKLFLTQENLEINKKDKDGMTALAYAFLVENTKAANMIITAYKDIINIDTDIALVMAIKINKIQNSSIIYLIENTKNINTQDKEGATALIYAVKNNDFELVSKIMEKTNVNINLIDNNGNTALNYATNDEVINILNTKQAQKNNRFMRWCYSVKFYFFPQKPNLTQQNYKPIEQQIEQQNEKKISQNNINYTDNINNNNNNNNISSTQYKKQNL